MVETTHQVLEYGVVADDGFESDAADLVVTRPPIPMHPAFDDAFTLRNPEITESLDNGAFDAAFDAMHNNLSWVWDAIDRVVSPTGIVCVCTRDVTRPATTSGGRIFPNQTRVIQALEQRGFDLHERIRWQKHGRGHGHDRESTRTGIQAGTGMLPPTASTPRNERVILVFRKHPREIELRHERRWESGYFYEEQQAWFNSRWELSPSPSSAGSRSRTRSRTCTPEARESTSTRLRSDSGVDTDTQREQVWPATVSVAPPIEPDAIDHTPNTEGPRVPPAIPFRLISMYSVREDTVFDPCFELSSGAVSLAAMLTGRSSIGNACTSVTDSGFLNTITSDELRENAKAVIRNRLQRHARSVSETTRVSEEFRYRNSVYEIPVVTQQEQCIRFHVPETAWLTETNPCKFTATVDYELVTPNDSFLPDDAVELIETPESDSDPSGPHRTLDDFT